MCVCVCVCVCVVSILGDVNDNSDTVHIQLHMQIQAESFVSDTNGFINS